MTQSQEPNQTNSADQSATDPNATDQNIVAQSTSEQDEIESSADSEIREKIRLALKNYKSPKGEPIDVEQMPESAWADESKVDFIRVVGIRLGEYGRVYDFETRGLDLKHGDAVVVSVPDKGLKMGWVSKPPIRLDNSELKLKLDEIVRVASEKDHQNHEKQISFEKRGYERAVAAVTRLNLKMTILSVQYSLDARKAFVYFSSEKRVDFRDLLRDLVHDLKAKVELRQVGARDETKQIGAIGPCGEETCCSRFIDKFHGVSIKMAKDQGLSLKPTKVSGMCGRLKCCLAYEYQTYVEGQKTVPRVGKCVKCKSGGGCGVVRDVDIPRQLVFVEMEDGNMVILPATEVVEERTRRSKKSVPEEAGEKMVATNDEETLKNQVLKAKVRE